jgi:predicted acylesterase/phospholipase RssA
LRLSFETGVTSWTGADHVIAVNVSAYRAPLFQDTPVTGMPVESLVRQLLSRSRAMTLMTVLERTLAIMQDGHVQDKLVQCPPDVMLCPKVGEVGLFDLRHLDGCIQAGMAEVHAHEAELVALRDKAARRPAWLERFRKRLMRMA